MNDLDFAERPTISDDALNELFALAWPAHERRTFTRVLLQSLSFIVAFDAHKVVGFVNVAWDGGSHAFILDPTVHPHYQRRGIGSELVRRAVAVATKNRVEWVHVDFESHLSTFYAALGFRSTDAGVLQVRTPH